MALQQVDCCPDQGANGVYLAEAGNGVQTFSTASERYLFETFRLRPDITLIVNEATLGQRMRFVNQANQDITQLVGTISFRPSRADLDEWIPRIIGGTKTANLFSPDGTVPHFSLYENTGGKIFEYYDCQVANAVFRGQSGQTLELTMDIQARSYAVKTAATAPNVLLGVGAASDPLVFSDTRIEIDSAVPADPNDFCFASFTTTINNNLSPRYYNHKLPQCVAEGQRVVSHTFSSPWNVGVANALFGDGDAAAGRAGLVRFVSTAALETRFEFAALKWPDRGPEVSGLGDIDYSIDAQAFAVSASPDIQIFNDSTP